MRLIGKLRDIRNTHKCLNECLSLTIKTNSQVGLHRLGPSSRLIDCQLISVTRQAKPPHLALDTAHTLAM